MPFRLRIALLALVTSGVVLVGFGVSFLAVTHRVGLEKVDREIRAIAEGQLHGWHPPGHWAAFNQSLTFIYGDESASRPVVIVRDSAGSLLFMSPAAPAEIAGLPLPTLALLEPPLGPRPPPGGGDDFVARLDLDGDNRVSPLEFDGPPGRFSDFDVNRDGYVSELEARQAVRDVPPRVGPPDPFGPAPEPRPRQRESAFQTVATAAGDWRVGILGNELVTLVVALNLADFSRDATSYRNALLVALPLALLLLGAAGWFLSTRALRPVAEITHMAQTLTASDLDRRIPDVATDAELRRLVEVLNGMLGRLQASFQQAERFSSDAAHELQTPLTVLQGELDNAIHAAASGSAEQQTYVSLLDEVRRLKSVVHKLLLLARADAGRLALNLKRTDLSALAAAAAEDLQTMAPGARVLSDIQPGVSVRADPDLLDQVLLNLTTNAAKYTPEGGLVRLSLEADAGVARLTVANAGESIPAGERERVFDRFHRLDQSRSRGAGGSGLGLSLARELARAHHGDLVLEAERPGMNAFTLTLPLAATPGADRE
ncbi:MAG: ATP-binding protein [Acidobacteriota bacterium]